MLHLISQDICGRIYLTTWKLLSLSTNIKKSYFNEWNCNSGNMQKLRRFMSSGHYAMLIVTYILNDCTTLLSEISSPSTVALLSSLARRYSNCKGTKMVWHNDCHHIASKPISILFCKNTLNYYYVLEHITKTHPLVCSSGKSGTLWKNTGGVSWLLLLTELHELLRLMLEPRELMAQSASNSIPSRCRSESFRRTVVALPTLLAPLLLLPPAFCFDFERGTTLYSSPTRCFRK